MFTLGFNLTPLGSTLLYLYGTEVVIKGALLNRSKPRDQTAHSGLQRLKDLDSILTAVERWFGAFQAVPLAESIGATLSIYTQFSHCIVLLFKLTTLVEPGWDREEVKKRVNLLEILEHLVQRIEDTRRLLKFVDAVGTGESGLFFKFPGLIRGLKAKFSAELLATKMQTDVQPCIDPDTTSTGDSSAPVDFSLFFADDPWLMDLMYSHESFDL
jgi:hypothetical protein